MWEEYFCLWCLLSARSSPGSTGKDKPTTTWETNEGMAAEAMPHDPGGRPASAKGAKGCRAEADALLKMRQDRGKAIDPARQPENDLLAGRWVSKGAMVAAYATLIVVTLGIFGVLRLLLLGS
ncbi:MAG: hypothetical protein WA884_00620 [Methyloceanibacter sp.]